MGEPTNLIAAIDELRAEKARCEERIRDIDDAIRALFKLTGGGTPAELNRRISEPSTESPALPEAASPAASRSVMVAGKEIPEVTLVLACHGKSIADAALTVLGLVGHAAGEDDLTAALQIGGVTFVSSHPVNSLRFALMRKARDTGAVKEFAPKSWGLTAWPEATNPNSTGFVVVRSKGGHMAASLKGLQAAKERGVRLGAPPRITGEHAPRIAELLEAKTPVKKIAETFGVSAPGMIKAIARLREEGHLPPSPAGVLLQRLAEIDESMN
jgi:hypothetical protein